MQMPEPFWNKFVLTGGSRDDVCGYEHSVSPNNAPSHATDAGRL